MRFDRVCMASVLVLSATFAACSGSDTSSGGTSADGGSSGGGGGGTGASGGGTGASGADGSTGGGAVLGTTEAGEATYYDADGTGACSFDASPNDLMVGAMNATEFAGSAVCGECLNVTGELGSVVVRVVDECPGCRANGGIDLSPQAFAKVAALDKGRVPVTLTLVSCDVTGNVKYRYKDGSSQYWTAIQVENHKIPIAKLEYRDASGTFTDMPRASYNYFIADKGVGAQPSGLALRLTAIDGQTLQDTIPASFSSTAPILGAAQFQ